MYVKRIVITGYRASELGIFQATDKKITIIKKSLTSQVRQFIEDGYQWFLVGGNLDIEVWGGEVVLDLKKEYPEIKLGVLFPYLEFGSNWNESNQQLRDNLVAKADYVGSVSHAPYQNKAQLQNHSQFLLTHSDASFVIYDEEYIGKCQHFYKQARRYEEQADYVVYQLTMDDLQNSVWADGF